MVLGFFPISYPPLEKYEKYGELTEDNHWGNKYVIPIIPMTQSEIDEVDAIDLVNNDGRLKEEIFEAHGIEEYKLSRDEMRNAYEDQTLTVDEFKELRILIKPIIAKLKLGDWDLALDDLNNLNLTSQYPDHSIAIIESIKVRVNDYKVENYE